MNAQIKVKVFTDSRPLLETLGSTSQVAEKGLRKSIAYLKEHLKLGSVESYNYYYNCRYSNKDRIKEDGIG